MQKGDDYMQLQLDSKRRLCEVLCQHSMSAYIWIHTGPSLRFPMASSQSFLLAVSSRISCCCCSDSWKVSSIFTRLEGGSATGDDSGRDTHIRLKQKKSSKLLLDNKIQWQQCMLKENVTLVDIKHLQAISKKTGDTVLTCLLLTTPCLTCFELHL